MLLLQTSTASWITFQNLVGALGVILTVGASALILFSRKREVAHDADRKNVAALNDLIKTKDLLLSEQGKEIETLSAEYRQIAQVIVKEVIAGWLAHADARCYQENSELRARQHELENRLAVFEKL